jgi:hypothetical protein
LYFARAGGPADKVLVERGRKAYGLGKYRRLPRPCDAVEGFAPPVVFRHAESIDRLAVVNELRDLFFERHPADKVIDALIDRL